MPSNFAIKTKLQISLQIIISATGQKELQSYFSSVFFQSGFLIQGMGWEGACAHAHLRCAVARVQVRAK